MAPLSVQLQAAREESSSPDSDSVAQKVASDINKSDSVELAEFVLDGFLVSVDKYSKDFNQRCNKHKLSNFSNNVQAPAPALGWPLAGNNKLFQVKLKRQNMKVQHMENENKEKQASDMDLMKERFAKLLLGEDMSGGSKGVSSALALSNAITNLSASIFGELWRLESLSPERKQRWRKEIDWLLSVTDYIVELVPTSQNTTDGSQVEIMVAKQRTDLVMNIPALRKLDAMLLDVLESFKDSEFWYEERSSTDSHKDRLNQQRQEHKWWLPTPKVPEGGLPDRTRKLLQNQRDAVKQILKAVMAINAQVLSEMEIPDVYLDSLPKNGKASLGDALYRQITAENFSPEALLSSIDLSTEHNILDLKNKIEASIAVWKRKIHKEGKSTTLSGWGSTATLERRELLENRAETLLLVLKQKYPGLPQSVLDMNKIQYNKDIGQSILESYSRVLESRAFNIMSRIDDVLYADVLAGVPLPPSSSDHSLSYASMRTNSVSDDQSSFWTPSPTCDVHRTPDSPKPFDHLVSSEKNQSLSPRSMTLSEYMGWGSMDNDNLSSIEKSPLNDHHKDGQQDPNKALKKIGAIATHKRLSYLERLECQGIVHSPAARD